MARRIIAPFFAGEYHVLSLDDLIEVLKNNPSLLAVPFEDGRLERFLRGYGKRYEDCVVKDSMEETVKNLAKILGLDLDESINLSYDTSHLVCSSDELLKAIKEGREKIELKTGVFELENVVIDKPVEIVGQGVNHTHVKSKILDINANNVKFKNLTWETESLIAKEPEIENANLSLKYKTSKGIQKIISKPIIIENDKVSYANVDFVFEEEGKIILKNCQFDINNCSFTGKTRIEFEGSSEGVMEDCRFVNNESENELVISRGNSKLKLKSCEFSDNKLSGDYGRCVDVGNNTENEIEGCKFVNNESKSALVFSWGYSKLKLKSCEFSGNKLSGDYGRCVEMKYNTKNEIESCKFVNNESESALVLSWGNSKLKLKSCEFSDNKLSGNYGRCVEMKDNTENEIEGCKFVNNESESELVFSWGNSKLKLKSCEFSDNKLYGKYGRCVSMSDNTENEIESCKFVNNKTENYIINAFGSSKVKINNSYYIDSLYSESPNVEIYNSKIGLIRYYNHKPKVYNTEVREWR